MKKFESVTKTAIKAVCGNLIPANASVTVVPDPKRPDRYATIEYPKIGIHINCKYVHMHMYVKGFIPITEETIREGVCDGSCESMIGDTVEPDGHDEYGFPSVLLALGMI